MSNADVAFATAFGTLVGGAFLVGFIQKLGGSDIMIGLLSGIPSLVGILQIPGAIIGRASTSYKRFVTPGGAIWRLGYIPFAFLPFLPVPTGLKLTLLIVCVLFASISTTFVGPIYNEWIAELVPAESRGVLFARRNAIATAVGAIIGILGAWILDTYQKRGQENLGFTLVYGFGLVCAAISMYFYMQMQDIPRPNPVRQTLQDGIRAIGNPFGDRNFRRVLVLLGVGVFGQQFAGNLFPAYALESLKLDFKIVQGTAVAMAIGNVLSARFWGFLADKYGNKPVLCIVAALLALNPVAWLVTIPGQNTYNAILLLSTHVLMGIFWCGINLCQFNIILATAKPEDRANYIGAGMTITAVIGGVSPILGGILMATLRHSLDPVVAYKIIFAASLVLRVIAVLFIFPVEETGSSRLKTTLSDLRRVTPGGIRAMRSLSRSADVESREAAIQGVGEENARLAADEVLKALHDPQPRVRRQAANAIARLGDPRATAELIHQIEEHPDLLEEEMIVALGSLGDPAAIPVLLQTLRSPRSLLRRAAAHALGRIGERSDAVVSALASAVRDPADVDLRRAALQTLRILEAVETEEVIRSAVHDPHPSVRIAAAEAIAELEIRTAAPDLRASLASFNDEGSSEVAYALGAVGVVSDIPMILAEAADSRSMITRRRCLLGIARILGVESSAYRLMLREGVERDTRLQKLLRSTSRRYPRLRDALTAYSSGDEPGALRVLGEVWPNPLFDGVSAEEAFLVGVPAVVKGLSKR